MFSTPLFAQSDDSSGQAAPGGEEAILLEESPPAAAGETPAPVWLVLRMVLVLALAALAIYGVVFFIKRAGRPPESKDPHLRALARIPLGGNASAAVLSVGSRAWLVGICEGGVSLLAEITEQEALSAMLSDEAQRLEETGKPRFTDFLSLLRRFNKNVPGPDADGEVNLHLDNLRDKQRRLRRFQ